MKLIFAHGWGFNHHFWDNVIEYLPEQYEYINIDFGYTSNDILTDIKTDDDLICVGHSMGCMWLLKKY